MRANARAVCLGLLALLLAVSGFWTWKLLQERRLGAPIAKAPPERERVPLGIIDILQKEEAAPPSAPARSPFFTRYSPPVPIPVYTNATVPPPPIPVRTHQVVVPPPPPHHPPPPPKTITLTFRGTMERSDGIVQALFEVKDSASKRSSFVRRHDSLYGIRVDSISLTGTVSVVRLDGLTNVMCVGNSETIVENP